MNTNPICIHCKVGLIIGESIDYFDPNIRVEFNYFSKGNLIKCWKCPNCGYSEDLNGTVAQLEEWRSA